MTTQQIADRLVELSRTGKMDDAYDELFADNAVGIEPEGTPNSRTEGLANLYKKAEKFYEMVEEIHGITVSDPLVADDYFSLEMTMDATFKGVGRNKSSEICVYEVADGKIVSEQFFYKPQQQG